MMSFPSWQLIPWHERFSYWEQPAAVRQALRDMIENDAREATTNQTTTLKQYIDHPDTLNGRIVNSDTIPNLLPSFRINPTQCWEAIEDPECGALIYIHKLSKLIRDNALSTSNNGPALMFVGGQSSGSSTGAAALGWSFDVVFDAPHADLDEALFIASRIQKEKCEIHLVYVDRDPISAMKAMLARSERTGRYIPLSRMAHAHASAPHTFIKLIELLPIAVKPYHIQLGDAINSSMLSNDEAIDSIINRKKPTESEVYYKLQTAYLNLLRGSIQDPEAWYPRDVLAGLNRTLDPWRRLEADHLLRRRVEAMAQRSAEGAPGPRGAAPDGAGEPGPGLG